MTGTWERLGMEDLDKDQWLKFHNRVQVRVQAEVTGPFSPVALSFWAVEFAQLLN